MDDNVKGLVDGIRSHRAFDHEYNPEKIADALTAQAAALEQKDAEIELLKDFGGDAIGCAARVLTQLGIAADSRQCATIAAMIDKAILAHSETQAAEIDSLRKQVVACREGLASAYEGLNTALGMVECEGFIPNWDYLRHIRKTTSATLAALPSGLADMVLVEREVLLDWAHSIDVDGTPAQVGPSVEEIRALAAQEPKP